MRKQVLALLGDRIQDKTAVVACGLQRLCKEPSPSGVLVDALEAVTKDYAGAPPENFLAWLDDVPTQQLEKAGWCLGRNGAIGLAALCVRTEGLALGAARHYAATHANLDVAERLIESSREPCIQAAEVLSNVLRDRSTSGEETARVDACLRYLLVKKPQMRGAWLRTLGPNAAADQKALERASVTKTAPPVEKRTQPPGLANLGNSCYANAVCRALHATAPLRRLLLQEAKMDADAPVTVDAAGNMYETDEYELACLEQGRTPFTRKGVNSDAEQDNYAMVPEPETPPASQGKKKPGWGTARAVGTVRGLEFGK